MVVNFASRWNESIQLICLLLLLMPGGALAEESPKSNANETADESQSEKKPESDEATADEVIVVTGSRQEELQSKSAVRATVLDALTIEESGAENLAELLEHYPSIEIMRSFRGSEVRIHGMDPKYVLILVDGRRQIGELGGAVDLERFPVSQIERVEVIKGASSGLYGSRALGGVINIITRNAVDTIEADLHLASGWGLTDDDYWDGSSLPANLDLTTRLGINHETWSSDLTGGFHQGRAIRLVPDTYGTTFPDFVEYDIGNKTQWEFLSGHVLHVGGEYSRRDNEGQEASAPKENPFGPPIVDEFEIKTITETASMWIGYDLGEDAEFKWSSEANLYLYRDQYLSNQVGTTAGDKYDEAREFLAEVRTQYDYLASEAHRFSVGAEVALQNLKSDRLEFGELDRFTGSIYAQDNWVIRGERDEAGALDFVPALRVDIDSQYGIHASPKLALRYEPIEKLVVRTALGSGFVAPGFKELGFLFENTNVGYKVLGNADLEPETSWDLDLSVEYQLTSWLWGSIGLYGSLLSNQISSVQCPDEPLQDFPSACDGELARSATGPVYAYRNIGKARVLSAEASIRARLSSYVTTILGYAHTDAREYVEDENGFSWELLPERALHRFTADLRLNLARFGFRASVKGSYVDGRPTSRTDEAGSAVLADAYAVLNARISQRIGGQFTLFAGVENIPNMFDPDDLIIRPRTVYAGINGRF